MLVGGHTALLLLNPFQRSSDRSLMRLSALVRVSAATNMQQWDGWAPRLAGAAFPSAPQERREPGHAARTRWLLGLSKTRTRTGVRNLSMEHGHWLAGWDRMSEMWLCPLLGWLAGWLAVSVSHSLTD